MTIQKANGDPWLLSGEAYGIYARCMYRPAFEGYLEKMASLSGDPSCHVFVCAEDGKNVGIAVFRRISCGTAEIEGIAVARERQRRGIGSFMIRSAALSLGVDRIIAETDGDAAAFYGHMGFSLDRFTRHFKDGDAVRYRCVLYKKQS